MKIKEYFTTLHITKGLALAILLSSFIYLEHYLVLNEYILMLIDTIFALSGLYLLISSNRGVWFFTGFFMGIFWLWWMAISFIYYHLPYLVPLAIIFFGLFWGVVFATLEKIASFFANFIEQKTKIIKYDLTIEIFRALVLLLLPFITPFGFDWFKPQLMFIDSIFGIEYWQFALIVITLGLVANTKRYLLLFLLIFAIDLKHPIVYKPSFLKDISLVTTHEDVRQKWKPQNQLKYTQNVIKAIDKAIKENKKLVILPESVLPYFLNLEQSYLKQMLQRSKKITIVVGSLYFKDKNNFRNSAYLIKDGDYTIANKVVLVPFGEANPLPSFMSKIVNKIFFDGAVDYKADSKYTYLKALGKDYKIAICYEGTNKRTFQDHPKYLIIISNNGWFMPSIEPTLQKLLLKYYVKLYKTTVYHAINGSKSYIITPHPEDTNE